MITGFGTNPDLTAIVRAIQQAFESFRSAVRISVQPSRRSSASPFRSAATTTTFICPSTADFRPGSRVRSARELPGPVGANRPCYFEAGPGAVSSRGLAGSPRCYVRQAKMRSDRLRFPPSDWPGTTSQGPTAPISSQSAGTSAEFRLNCRRQPKSLSGRAATTSLGLTSAPRSGRPARW